MELNHFITLAVIALPIIGAMAALVLLSAGVMAAIVTRSLEKSQDRSQNKANGAETAPAGKPAVTSEQAPTGAPAILSDAVMKIQPDRENSERIYSVEFNDGMFEKVDSMTRSLLVVEDNSCSSGFAVSRSHRG